MGHLWKELFFDVSVSSNTFVKISCVSKLHDDAEGVETSGIFDETLFVPDNVDVTKPS